MFAVKKARSVSRRLPQSAISSRDDAPRAAGPLQQDGLGEHAVLEAHFVDLAGVAVDHQPGRGQRGVGDPSRHRQHAAGDGRELRGQFGVERDRHRDDLLDDAVLQREGEGETRRRGGEVRGDRHRDRPRRRRARCDRERLAAAAGHQRAAQARERGDAAHVRVGVAGEREGQDDALARVEGSVDEGAVSGGHLGHADRARDHLDEHHLVDLHLTVADGEGHGIVARRGGGELRRRP